MSPDEVDAVFRQKPALHRYPGSMAKRTHALATHIVESYDGDAAAIWRDVQDPKELFDRLRALPGYGEEKAKIFLAILGKRLGVAPPGWEQYAGAVLRLEPALGGRHRLTRSAPACARVEAGAEEGGQDQVAGVGEQLAHLVAEVRADRTAVVGIRLV